MQVFLVKLRKSILGWAAIGVLASCANHKSAPNQLFQLPWPDSKGNYALREVPIQTLTDLGHSSGPVARISVNPFVGSDGAYEAEEPSAHYLVNKDGLVVPSDFLTLQMFTLYAHTERLRDLDQRMGLASALSYPRKIGLAMSLLQDGKSDRRMLNNAMFYAPADAFFFVPYTESQLPISLNAGLIAHEHFHALFNAIVMRDTNPIQSPKSAAELVSGTPYVHQLGGLSAWINEADGALADKPDEKPVSSNNGAGADQKYRDFHNLMVIRALNEGFADFWGWVYTGDEKFIGTSLPSVLSSRRMDRWVGPTKLFAVLTHKKQFLRNPNLEEAISRAYDLSSYFSRVLVIWAKLLEQNQTKSIAELQLDAATHALNREKLALQFIKSLPQLSQVLNSKLQAGEFLSPNIFNEIFFNPSVRSGLTSTQCDFLNQVFVIMPDTKEGFKCGADTPTNSSAGGSAPGAGSGSSKNAVEGSVAGSSKQPSVDLKPEAGVP